jgi:hypothetical protein
MVHGFVFKLDDNIYIYDKIEKTPMLYHNSIIPSNYTPQKWWLSFPQLTVKNPAGGSLEKPHMAGASCSVEG